MYTCMYTYISICVYICLCTYGQQAVCCWGISSRGMCSRWVLIYMYLCIYIHVHTYMYICIYVDIHTYERQACCWGISSCGMCSRWVLIYMYLYIYTRICTHVCIHIYPYVYTYVCIHIGDRPCVVAEFHLEACAVCGSSYFRMYTCTYIQIHIYIWATGHLLLRNFILKNVLQVDINIWYISHDVYACIYNVHMMYMHTYAYEERAPGGYWYMRVYIIYISCTCICMRLRNVL